MAASWALAVKDRALERGFIDVADQMDHFFNNFQNAQVNKAISGCLPRGRRAPPVLSDFLQPQPFAIADFPDLQQLAPGQRLPASLQAFPPGSRLVRFSKHDGGDYWASESMENIRSAADGPESAPAELMFAMVGIPRNYMDYIAAACTLTHPLHMALRVGDALEKAIHAHISDKGLEFRRVQCSFSKLLLQWCKDLDRQEGELRAGMPAHLRKILEKKRVCVFKRALEHIQYPDVNIADEMSEGFPLGGWLPASGVFPGQVRAPSLHLETLVSMADVFSAKTIASTKATSDLQLDDMLWQATLDEVAAGFLSGPFECADLPPGAVVSPRFGLVQKGKLRPIDNFSASHVNATVGLQEKFMVDAIDKIAGMIKRWMQLSPVPLKLVGRTFDLRKAYRQIGINSTHLNFAWISVFDPAERRAKLFKMESMPFGATASVAAFLRVSQALKMIGTARASLVWSSFYDDFVCICEPGAAVQTERMINLLFSSLGWELSSDADKNHAFSELYMYLFMFVLR